MKKIIYADNAATTELNKVAFDAMTPWLLEYYGNPSQPYSFSREPKRALEKARADIASCINADPEEIYFTSCGTEGDNFAIKGLGATCDTIITTQFEHHAVLNPCKSLEKAGCKVLYLKPSSDGYITSDKLSRCQFGKTTLVSVMFANNEIGTIQPIKTLCELAHAKGAFFHTDAVQAVGHVSIDVKELGIDILTASAHKFNGPKGVGFMYIKKSMPLFSFLEGGSQEKGVRAGTENVASIVGMSVALKKNCESLENTASYLNKLTALFLDELKQSKLSFVVNGGNNKLPGLTSISFLDGDGEMLLHRLDLMGIIVSTGAACDSKTTQISHVLKAIDLDEKYANGTIRISFSKNNTIEDAKDIAKAIIKILQ